MPAIEAAMALNVAVVAPPATITDAGTASETLLLRSEIAIPPLGAAIFNVIEHVAL